MEGADGTQSTIDNTTAFVTSRNGVDLSLRHHLLITASSACVAVMGGISREGMSLSKGRGEL